MQIGQLISFDAGTYTAVVELRGSFARRLTCAVSRGIPSAEMVAGRNVAAWFAGAGDNPSEAVIIAVW